MIKGGPGGPPLISLGVGGRRGAGSTPTAATTAPWAWGGRVAVRGRRPWGVDRRLDDGSVHGQGVRLGTPAAAPTAGGRRRGLAVGRRSHLGGTGRAAPAGRAAGTAGSGRATTVRPPAPA